MHPRNIDKHTRNIDKHTRNIDKHTRNIDKHTRNPRNTQWDAEMSDSERVAILEDGQARDRKYTDSNESNDKNDSNNPNDSDYISLGASKSVSGASEDDQPAKEGGWGWVIVAASFLCNMVLDGIGYSFGVMLQPLSEEFDSGKGSMSFVGSLLMGGYLLIGPVAAASVNRYGTRLTCIAGSLISSVAIFASSFSNSLACLVITYGIFGGVGIGLIYVPAVVAVGEYFSTRLSLATGICVTGSGVGTIVFAPFSTWLVTNYGWRGCNRVMALLCLACSLCGLVMLPGNKNGNTRDEETEGVTKETVEDAGNAERRETSLWSRSVGKIVNKQLLSNVPFRLIWIGNLVEVMGVYCPYVYLPVLATSFGINPSSASLLISVVGITNTVGRILSGWIADFPGVNAIIVTVIALTIGGFCAVSFCLLGYLSSNIYIFFIVFCGLLGFFLSAVPVVTSAMLVDVLGIEMLTTSFGALNLVRGISVFLGPPISGFVLDRTGDVNAPFYISGGLLIVAAAFHLAAWVVHNNSSKRRDGYQRIN